MKTLVVALSLLLSGCASTVKVGAYHDFQGEVKGDNPFALVEFRTPITKHIGCSYVHISHYTSGFPFNNREEQNIDMVGCDFQVSFQEIKEFIKDG